MSHEPLSPLDLFFSVLKSKISKNLSSLLHFFFKFKHLNPLKNESNINLRTDGAQLCWEAHTIFIYTVYIELWQVVRFRKCHMCLPTSSYNTHYFTPPTHTHTHILPVLSFDIVSKQFSFFFN